MIKILIADDSATETLLLKHIFEAEEDMEVIGTASNGKEAVALAAKLKPDLITMDIQMPIMDGFEATKWIMMNNPVPIVVISSTLDDKERNHAFLALEAGAVTVLNKPVNINDTEFSFARKRIINIIRIMAGIKVVRKRFPPSPERPFSSSPNLQKNAQFEIVAIGASVGGPQALRSILSRLPGDFPLPIVIVQHISPGFLPGFCEWLDQDSKLRVKCAEHFESIVPGTVYFAPENHHLEIKRMGMGLNASLLNAPPFAGFRPSITVLLQSVAKTCGKNAIGFLLTGMGRDGAQGLLEMKQNKGHTLVQDEKSSVVFGMGKVAQSLGAVDQTIALDNIVDYLNKLRPLNSNSDKQPPTA